MIFKLIFFCVVLWIQNSLAFPEGGGTSACETLQPNHPPHEPQVTDVPVDVNLSTQSLVQGEIMTITIEARGGFEFRGFMIQARTLTEELEVLGEFDFLGNARNVVCESLPPNSVATHSQPTPKTMIQLNWRAPFNFVGIINFQ